MPKKHAPAAGEKNAIRGYFSQYEFSSSTLIHLMQDNRFDAISVCDTAAGIFDDLVVFSGDKLLAYQIKSERYPAPFRLRTELISNQLIKEIAKSWTSLKEEYPNNKICINYILPGYPSTNDKKYLANFGHSAQFLSFLSDSETDLSKDALLGTEWAPLIRELITCSTLTEDQFFEMFCQLKFFDHGELIALRLSKLDSYVEKKAYQLKHLLPEIVANRGAKKIWTEQEIFDKLGWSRIPVLRAQHNFPLYPDVQINPLVEDELKQAIDDHDSGYISLIGPPGTGKSTTLQRAISTSANRGVVRYLAFLPDQRHGLGRAEATDFLNDVTYALNKLGFSRNRFADDEQQLREELLKQLEEAHELFCKNSQKTLIVVDGLDHIQREEKPQHNFLSVLPPPQSIPEGVLFILGSQFLQLEGLAPRIVQQASLSDRCIIMRPLPKRAIFDMAEKAELPEHVDKNLLFNVCEGHPLVARYYIEKLSETTSIEEADHLLNSGEIGTSVDQMYELVWKALDPDSEAKHALALLARADNSISPVELAHIVSDNAVENVLKKAGFLLSGLKKGQLRIFHNSFRLFLAHETRKRFGHEDLDIDRTFYSELAEIAACVDRNSAQRWLELRYRSRARDTQAVKQMATPDLFRNQLEEFRPGKDVYVDLRLAYGAIEDRNELSKFVQLMMIEKEVDYRLEAISELDLVKTYLSFEEQDLAFDIALSNGVSTDGVLELMDWLYKRGDNVRSRMLFEMVEPIEYFFGQNKQTIHNPDSEGLYDWVERAHRFRNIEDILDIVTRLPFDERIYYDPTVDMKFALAGGVISDDPTADIDRLCDEVGLDDQFRTALLVQTVHHLNAGGARESVNAYLARLYEKAEELSIPDSRICARVALESGKYEMARGFLANVMVIATKDFRDYQSRQHTKHLFASTYSVARISEHLGRDVQFDRAENDDFQNKVLEHIIGLGRLQGRLEISHDPRVLPVIEELKKACLFFAHADSGEKYQYNDPITSDSLEWLAKTLVRIASLNGDESLRMLEKEVEQLYARGNNRISKFNSFRLVFAKEVYNFDGDQAKAIQRVRYLNDIIETEYTPHSAVQTRVELASSLAEIDAIDKAKEELFLIHKDTCGYWLAAKKEPQYLFWNEAFGRACRTAPEKSREFSAKFAQFVIGLSETEGRDTGYRIIYELLQNATTAPSQCAGIISRLIETDLANWGYIVAAALQGIVLLRKDLAYPCFILYCRLVIPFASDKAYNAIAPIYQRLPEKVRKKAEQDFVKCAQLFADTSNEESLLSHLKTISSSENEEIVYALKRAQQELAEIRNEGPRKGGSSSSYDEKEKELNQIESLSALIDFSDGIAQYGQKEDVDYSYARRATKLLEVSSLPELIYFLEERSITLKDAKFTIAATSRLIDLGGAPQKADELYLCAEKYASDGNWSRWLGGEKIAFQKLRKKREGEASQEKGFETIINDFANGRASAQMVLPDLDELFDLVAPEAAWDDIWSQVQEHLTVYREYLTTEPVNCCPDVSSHEDLMGHIFQTGFSLLNYVLTDRLRDSMLEIAVQEEGQHLFDVIAGMLLSDERFHRELAAIIWKLQGESLCKDLLIKYAKKLSQASDFVVTNIARSILSRFKVEFDMPFEDLPVYYELAVLGDENAENFERLAGIEPGAKFWLDNPWYWTTILGFEIKTISKGTDIEIEAIRRRCAYFMQQVGGEEAFGPQAEEQLLIKMKNLDLRFPYARLIPYFALKALGRVIEELIRANHIDFRVLPLVWSSLGGPNTPNYQFDVDPRPDWIIPPTLPKIDHWKVDANVWLQMAPENSFVPIIEGWFVLAEQTEFTISGSWKKYSAIRTSLPNPEWLCDPDENLFGLPEIVNLEHLNILLKEREQTILCTIDDPMYGDLRSSILTFNNDFLGELGWKRSHINPFEIHDGDGLLVAKTYIWMDGVGYPENSYKERSGHGHVVMITSNARKRLKEHFGKIGIRTRVIHRYSSNDGEYECTYFNGAPPNTLIESGFDISC